ncbi:hypothetical protein NDU88_005366, partial [Pleurodeles waltl]
MRSARQRLAGLCAVRPLAYDVASGNYKGEPGERARLVPSANTESGARGEGPRRRPRAPSFSSPPLCGIGS